MEPLDLRRYKHELERLVLARGDIAAAAATWRVLNAYEEVRDGTGPKTRHISWDDAWWGLWTGAVVSYARPFTQSRSGMALGKRWWGQIHNADARLQHRWVMNYRNQLWAHTERTALPTREVEVSFHGARERRIGFAAPINFQRLVGLCEYWHSRLDPRIAELVTRLREASVLPPDAASLLLAELPDQAEQ
jgi:hypothetical protein